MVPWVPLHAPSSGSAHADSRRVIHVLTGCTAVGKTELALGWAEHHDAEILSCDSLLFYRGMDIGTAKPSREELARVPHHLIDINDVRSPMDITRYVALARVAAEEIIGRGRRVLVTGGSGFYLKAFFSPVSDGVTVPPEIRDAVSSLTLDKAVARLHALNPEGLGSLDTANPRRVARALERCLSTGRTLRELAEAFARQRSPFSDWVVHLVRLEREPQVLNERIDRRVRGMLDAGLIEEVRGLLANGLRENPSAARAIGYRETIAMLEGTLAEGDLPAAISQNTRALVKKQRTWFRTQLPPGVVLGADEAAPETLFPLG